MKIIMGFVDYYPYHGLLWEVCESQFIIIYLDCHNHEVEKLTEHKTTKVDVVSERKSVLKAKKKK